MKHKFASWLVIGTGLLIATSQRCSVLSAQDQQSADRSLDAQKWLNDGVEAFKRAQNDEAIEDFKKAKELDPSLTKARLFLATAYASQYIPGAPSAENIRYGEQAVREYTEILETDPNNLSAIDGIGSILYQMARTPLNVDKMDESKSYHKKHTQLAPDSPTQWYWIGIIDWEIAFRANKELRAEWMKKTSRDLQPSDALPEEAQQKFILKYSDTVQEGIASLEH